MARRASDILDRHRAALAGGEAARRADDAQFALDNAVFTAVLDAANECLGRFDARPADDRWCDALLQVLNLAGLAELAWLPPPGATRPSRPGCGAAPAPGQAGQPGQDWA